MGRKRKNKGARLAAGVLVACFLTVASAVEGLALGEPIAIDVSELDPSRYPVGTPVVIEGRYAGRIANNMALHGSSTIFVLTPDADVGVRIDWLNPNSYLRVEGRVAFKEPTNTYYISVHRVESVENLSQRVASAIADPLATSESLYGAGIAARRWAKGHPNDRLLELAEWAITKGLRMEDLQLGPEDWEGYLRLAEKAEDMLGKTSLPEYYVRWGIRTFILSKGKRRAETYYEAARKAERLMPESPFAEILLENGFSIEKGLHNESGRRNHYALAEKALEIFGKGNRYWSLFGRGLDQEHRDLAADDYQGRYVLARKIRETHPAYAQYRVIVTEAVLAEKADMDMEDAGAWNRLGDRILFFLDDSSQAAFYFKEAFRRQPGNKEAAAKLRKLGYVYYRGGWWRPEEFARSELLERARELEELAAAGKVAVGMSRAQVLRAKGEPDFTARSSGGWGATLQWVYSGPTETLYVSLMADTVIARGTAPSGE